MVDDEADVAVARAARAEGVPMIFSNQASRPMEACARELGGSPRWFQLYWSIKDDLVASFVERAEACGCEAIVVTLDTTMLGWRTRDLDIAYLPFLRGKGIAQYTSDPVFRRIIREEPVVLGKDEQPKPTPQALRTLVQLTRAYPGGFVPSLRSGDARAAVQTFTRIYSRPSLTWENLPFLREHTKLPILLKGSCTPTTRGGRSTRASTGSSSPTTAAARSTARPRRSRRCPGSPPPSTGGSRSSSTRACAPAPDAFKALALGATAVGLGRPYAYGLAIAGEAGVREVLQNFKADFDLTLGLAGCRTIADIGPRASVSAAERVPL